MRLSTQILVLPAAVFAGCQEESGNYYCDETDKIQFNSVGFSGSYNRVTSFNDDHTCSSTSQSFSGSLSPFDEELSVHFRGPIQLENFAVYTKSSSTNQKREAESPQQHHVHREKREPAVVTQFAVATDIVTVGGNDAQGAASPTSAAAENESPVTTSAAAAVSSAAAETSVPWYETYDWTSSSEAAAAPATSEAAVSSSEAAPTTSQQVETSSSTSSPVIESSSSRTTSSSPSESTSSSSGSWSKIASYNADSASSSGLTFMNNLGGSGSGTFSFTWGNSLSYAASDGVSAASSPQTLEKTTVPSDKEFIIFSDSECGANNGDCGYYRPGTVANHGFGGSSKIFLFEFSMPTDTQGSEYTANHDMPAIWLLNAQIPRTLQYGLESCSCWSSGCGEMDLFEVLTAGSDKMKATIHDKQGNNGGGPSDYFSRPTSGTMSAAVIFEGESVTLVKLDSFPSDIDDIDQWTSNAQTKFSL